MKVIDTLSEGFGATNRRLWIVAIPILVDLFLWLGPRATIGPVLAQLLQTDVPVQYGDYAALIQQFISGFNVFSMAALYLPSLVVRLEAIPLLGLASDFAVNSSALLLGLAVAALLVGLWISCFYLGLIAQLVRDGQTDLRLMLRAVWRYWRRLIAFLVLVCVALMVAAIPVGGAYVILSSFSPAAGDFLAFLVQIGLLWAIVYLFFSIQALLLSDAGPLMAVRLSVTVIAGNFWAALALIGLTFLISIGLPFAWQLLATNPAGLLAAIVGNAYIGTGVAAAGFLFYKERLERLTALAAKTTQEAR